jgi:hypothetical protein
VRRKSKELLQLLLRAQSKSEILSLQSDLRKLTQNELATLLDSLNAGVPKSSGQVKRAPADGSAAARIVHMLRSEAKLSDTEAIIELKRELGSAASSERLGEQESLENWVAAACAKIPPGEILGAALTVAERLSAARKDNLSRKKRNKKGG